MRGTWVEAAEYCCKPETRDTDGRVIFHGWAKTRAVVVIRPEEFYDWQQQVRRYAVLDQLGRLFYSQVSGLVHALD